jgi:hypothetical protein
MATSVSLVKTNSHDCKTSVCQHLKLKRAASDSSVPQTLDTAGPLLLGSGDTNYLCGNCGFVIASGMAPGQRVAIATATAQPAARNRIPTRIAQLILAHTRLPRQVSSGPMRHQ